MEKVKAALNDLVDSRTALYDIYNRCSKATIITKDDMTDILNKVTEIIDASTIILLKGRWNLKETLINEIKEGE